MDADYMVKAANDAKIEVTIPSRARRNVPKKHGQELYKERKFN
jgi:hypothetical protein